MIEDVKRAIPISTDAYDVDIYYLIEAAKEDLNMLGLPNDENDPVVRRAIITYCRMHFGSPPNYDRLKASYDEQRAQMLSAHGKLEAMRDA